jgi:hypothetical protein
VPWCKYFIPKIAAAGISPDDPNLNDHIMYAKCIRGHVLKDASDWIQCENLPAPDSKCWQEGGETLFTLAARKRAGVEQPAPSKETPRNSARSQVARS